MVADPLRALKNKVTAAIEWRAREAVRVDEETLAQLAAALTEQSVEFTRRLSALVEKVELLEARVVEMEERHRRSGGSVAPDR